MEINHHLASPVSQNATYDNGYARVREKAQEAVTKNNLPSAFYHGSTDQIPDIGYDGLKKFTIKVQSLGVAETSDAREARYHKMFDLITSQLGKDSIDLKHAYVGALDKLPPELQSKDWGFSVTDGEIKLWENNDQLSKSDRASIKSAFDDYGIENLSNKVADTVIAAVQADRGPNETSGFGKYDVSKENFGKIIDLRSYIESHMEGGKYGSMTTRLTDPNDDAGTYMFTGINAITDQLSVRANPKYAIS